MKKVTIITPPEYEGLVLEALGRAKITQLRHVAGSEFEGIKVSSAHSVEFKKLYQKVQTHLLEPLDLNIKEVPRFTPSTEELQEFVRDPEEKINSLITKAESLINEIKVKKEEVHIQNNKLISELQAKIEVIEAEKDSKKQERFKLKTRLDSVSALEPDELKNCFSVGVVKNDFIPQLNEYLKRYPNSYTKISKVSNDESIVFVFGDEENRKWIEALFLVYDIKDIYDVLNPADVLLVLDESKRQKAIKKYKENLSEFEKTKASEEEYDQRITQLKHEYESKIEANEKAYADKLKNLQEEQKESFSVIGYYARILQIYSRKNAPVLRGEIISVLQGYTQETQIMKLREAIEEVEKSVGVGLYIEVSELDEHDHHAPTPEKDFKSDQLQPLWILTRLRGWPSAQEINPGHILVLIFCFQFGLMFGDIGQGLIFLVLGLALRGRFEKGMMKYLTTLFIPLGISAIIFGFMYDSFFLVEHAISDWLHNAHINLPFHYPIMPNPIHDIGELMNLIFLVGALEIVFASLLGAANAAKEKNYVGMLGEHGFGMGLYVTGLYLSAGNMFTEGINVVTMVGNWPFKLMLAGMGLSFAEPVLHSLLHGHGVGMESIGEGIGGLLMTFVEGLANMFSFLRIAAFALAHVSLSVASDKMGHAIGSPILALVIMNLIALSFEFVSSSVQSLRLLYYEFMGKFFQGGGRPFRPFRIRDNLPQ
jgi:V/A-type H+-transporting ATPase subunit I